MTDTPTYLKTDGPIVPVILRQDLTSSLLVCLSNQRISETDSTLNEYPPNFFPNLQALKKKQGTGAHRNS